MKSESTIAIMRRIARSDRTFSLLEGQWMGKCLICNGRLSFRDWDGFGANIEHILPRVAGGDNELSNLALTHPTCNGEKGRQWDAPKKHRHPIRQTAYRQLVDRLQARRVERWRQI